MTKATLISLSNILLGFSLQLIFLYFITPPGLMDTYVAQISIPFLFAGLTIVSLREDFYSSLLDTANKITFSQSIISFILSSSIFCIGLMYLQGWDILICILGSLYYIISCFLAVTSALIKKLASNIVALLPQSLTYIATLIIFMVFISKDFTPSILMVTTFASIASLVIFIMYLFLKTSLQIKFVISKHGYEIKLRNILHTSIFVIPPAIEAYFISFLNTSDITHLGFVHRIYTALTGIGVFIIFYKLEKILKLKNQIFEIKKLLSIFLILILILLMHFILMKYQILEPILNIFNLNDYMVILISGYFLIAYGINLFVYYIFRSNLGALFSLKEIIIVLTIFILINSYGLFNGANLIIYLIFFVLSWVFVGVCTIIKIRRDSNFEYK
jgi:hypothetical protein